MVAKANTQSLASFQETADATIDRLNRTGEHEVLTIDGRPRAVLLSPEAFENMRQKAIDAEAVETESRLRDIGRALEDVRNGNVREAGEFFADIRKQLLDQKAAGAK